MAQLLAHISGTEPKKIYLISFCILAQSFILGVDKSAVRQNRSGIEIKK